MAGAQAFLTLSVILLITYVQKNDRVSFDEDSKMRMSKTVMTVVIVLSYMAWSGYHALAFLAAVNRVSSRVILFGGVEFILCIFTSISVLDMLFHFSSNIEFVMLTVDTTMLVAMLIAVTYAFNARTLFLEQQRAQRQEAMPVAGQPAGVYVNGAAPPVAQPVGPAGAQPVRAVYAQPVDPATVPYAQPVHTEPLPDYDDLEDEAAR